MEKRRVARVFVSSTFRDMHSERDYLASVVFPELRERCRARQVELVDIDLRWGVTEADAEDDKVVDICMEEIERSRPFFIALLGERYGWAPLPRRIEGEAFSGLEARLGGAELEFLRGCYPVGEADGSRNARKGLSPGDQARLLGLLEKAECRPFGIPAGVREEDSRPFAWLLDARAGNSVTALEIRHGVLENPAMKERAYFYFRDGSAAVALPEDMRRSLEAEGPDSAARQERLKGEIRAAYPAGAENLNDYAPAWAGLKVDAALLRLRGGFEEAALAEIEAAAGAERVVGPEGFARLSPEARRVLAAEGVAYARRESLEAFGAQVLADLRRAIDLEFPELPRPRSELEREAAAHERWRRDRARGFLGRAGALARIEAYGRASGGKALVVLGRPGSGKSALVARAVEGILARERGAFVLESFTGATRGSQDLAGFLSRAIAALRAEFGLAEPAADARYADSVAGGKGGFEALRAEFSSTLSAAARAAGERRIWLAVDAVNQMLAFNDPANLSWVPLSLPPNVRMILSAAEGEVGDSARRLGLPTIELAPLDGAEARELARSRLAAYRKELGYDAKAGIDQLEALLGKREALLPLYLAVACEELRISPRFEDLSARITSMAEDVRGLFEEVLGRLELEHGEALVRDALACVELSVGGLAESEILALLAPEGEGRLPPRHWARLRRSLADYLKDSGEGDESLLDVFHLQLSEAIRRRYCGFERDRRRYARMAALGFEAARGALRDRAYVPSGLALDCGVYALRCRDLALLGEIWGESFRAADETGNEGLLAIPRRSLDEATLSEPSREFAAFLGGFAASPRAADVAALLAGKGQRCLLEGRREWASALFEASSSILESLGGREPEVPGYARDLAVSYSDRAALARSRGDSGEARRLYEAAFGIMEGLVARFPDKASYRRDLAIAYDDLGRCAERGGDTEAAAGYFEKGLDIMEGLVALYPRDRGCKRGLSIACGDSGRLAQARGDAELAGRRFSRGMELLRELGALDPADASLKRELSAAHANLGDLAFSRGDAAGVREHFEAARSIMEEAVALDPDNVPFKSSLCVAYFGLGRLAVALGDAAGALDSFGKFREAMESLVALDPGDAGHRRDLALVLGHLGRISGARGDSPSARAYFERAVEAMETLVALDPGDSGYRRDLSVACSDLGQSAAAQGDGAEARARYERAAALLESLVESDPANALHKRELAAAWNNLAEVAGSQGDSEAAEAYYGRFRGLMESLAALDPGNVDYRRGLCAFYGNRGRLAFARGDAAEAIAFASKALSGIEDLLALEPGNVAYLSDLAVTRVNLGSMAQSQGDAEGARRQFEEAAALLEPLVAGDPGNADYRRYLGVARNDLGALAEARGEAAEARRLYALYLEGVESLVALDPANAAYRRDLAAAAGNLGQLARRALGDLEAARGYFSRELEAAEFLVALDSGNAGYKRILGYACGHLGALAQDEGDGEAAAKYLVRCLEANRELVALDPSNAGSKRELGSAYNNLGNLAAALGDAENASECFGQLLAIMEELVALDPGNPDYRAALAMAYWNEFRVCSPEEELRWLGGAKAILDRLAAEGAGNAQLADLHERVEAELRERA